ncbi:MAG: OmpH family outer membrane protein [Kiritimatiellia bacterium]
MKRLMLVGAMMAMMPVIGEMKVGTVDMMLLVRNHPSYEVNKNMLMSTEKDYQKRLDGLKSELDSIQEEGKKLADEYRNPMLAQSVKTKIEGDIATVQQKFMAAQQKLRSEAMRNQQELSDLEARLLKAQAEDLKARIATFAEKNGYDLVIDASAALFARKSLDVTDEVLRSMNVDPKKAREKNEGK